MRQSHDYNETCQCWKCKVERNNRKQQVTKQVTKSRRAYKPKYASRAEQYGRYLDCGSSNWDDRS